MKKIILMGRTGCGKTTLTQALRGENIHYHKTQYVNYHDVVIDTPGEYIESKELGRATEPYSLYSPNITCMANRDVIGIVTHVDCEGGNPERAENWLRLAGCKTVFWVNSRSREGVDEILAYLSKGGPVPKGKVFQKQEA